MVFEKFNKKQKRLALGIGATALVALGGTIYLMNENNVFSSWFNLNQSTNEIKVDDNQQQIETTNNVTDKTLALHAEAIQEAKNSKYKGNQTLGWELRNIYKEPKHVDYKMDYTISRAQPYLESFGVNESKAYDTTVYNGSYVRRFKDKRNAKDEVYSLALDRFEKGFNEIKNVYKQGNYRGTAFPKDAFTKTMIEYFQSNEVNSLKAMHIFFPLLKDRVVLDRDSFRLVYTDDTEKNNTYVFEVVIKDVKTDEQLAYFSGWYNSVLKSFQIQTSVVLMDGDVEYDLWNINEYKNLTAEQKARADELKEKFNSQLKDLK